MLEPRLLNPFVKVFWKSDRHVVDGWHYHSSHFQINKDLTHLADNWIPESGFFRVGQSDLDPAVVSNGNSLVRKILTGNMGSIAKNTKDSNLSGSHQTRAFGHLLVRHCFSSALHSNRNPRIADWTARYVRDSVIPDDVRRRATSHYANLPQLRLELSRILEHEEFTDGEPRDMLDVAAMVAPNEQSLPEIYQRLVLSTTGFLGTAVEWLCIDLTKYPHEAHAREGFIRESLRLSSPAWRLTRTARREVTWPGDPITKDSELILNIFAANRDPLAWRDPRKFESGRWNCPLSPKNELSFGKGKRACPAQTSSLRFLEILYTHITTNYAVAWHPYLGSRPLVGTLNAPPLGRMVFRPLSKDNG